ncbi:MAG: PAS domain-containing protein, partial [Tunicatimonas sp.]|uniref:PAS domain-containing protein n=1 Tax=Tunicatimonas sp. TaxID=1940096 RepID=UPI003C78B339
MIKERVGRLLNEEKDAVLLLSERGELLFLNAVASTYFQEVGITNAILIYSLVSPDTEAVLRKLLSQKESPYSTTLNFRGIIEANYSQILTHFWLSRTSTSQEDIFIVILEIATKTKATPESVRFYKTIIDHSPDIVSVYDADFNCTYVSNQAYYQLGHSLSDYYTSNGFLQFLEVSYRPAVALAIEKDTRNRVQFSKYYYFAHKKSGEPVKITNFITRIFEENSQLYQIVANERISLVETNILTPTKTREELILADTNYHIYYISQSIKELLDVAPDNSLSLFSVVHSDDHAKLLTTPSRQGDTTSVSSIQLRILQSLESFRSIDATVHRFFNDHGQMVCIVIRWQELGDYEENQAWLPTVGEQSLPQSAYVDPTENLQERANLFLNQDLTIRNISSEAEEALGYAADELQGQNIVALIHHDAQVAVKEQIATAFSQPVPNVVCLVKKKDNTYQPFDIAPKTIDEGGGPTTLVITLHTMSFTDPKLFQVVLDHLPDAVFLLKYSDLSIIEANSSASVLLQEDRSQLVGTDFFSLWDAQVTGQLRLFFNHEAKFATQDIQYITRQGRSFWGNTTIKPMIDGSVSQENIVVLRIVDITDRKEQEIKLQRYSAQESISAREKFLSEISHEIRTPLNAVLGMTHLMLQSNPREDQRKMLQTLKFSGDNLTALINDLLDLSKIKAGQLKLSNKEFNLIEFIQGTK